MPRYRGWTADDENSCDYDESDDNDSSRKWPIYEQKETGIRTGLRMCDPALRGVAPERSDCSQILIACQ